MVWNFANTFQSLAHIRVLSIEAKSPLIECNGYFRVEQTAQPCKKNLFGWAIITNPNRRLFYRGSSCERKSIEPDLELADSRNASAFEQVVERVIIYEDSQGQKHLHEVIANEVTRNKTKKYYSPSESIKIETAMLVRLLTLIAYRCGCRQHPYPCCTVLITFLLTKSSFFFAKLLTYGVVT